MPSPNPIRALPETDAAPETPAPAATRTIRDEPPDYPAGDPGPMAPATHGSGSLVAYPYNGLPPNSPAMALGHKDDVCFFLAPDGEMIDIHVEKFSIKKLSWLYGGDYAYVETMWGRIGKKGAVTGIEAEIAYGDHQKACRDVGVFDPVNAMRGAGAWRGAGGSLIWNFGDRLLVKPRLGDEQWVSARKIGRHVYQLRPPMAPPTDDAATCDPGLALLESFRTWNWARPDLDPLLLIGWIVAAMFGGALRWRPLIWLTGERNTGKSTIEGPDGYFDHIFGPNGAELAANATAAGIYSSMGFDSRPVCLDEMEAKSDNRKAQATLDIAMQACSGGVIVRGSQNHVAIKFNSRSGFGFSSINIPPLSSALLSRMAILELGALIAKDRSGILPPHRLQEIGAALRRRIIDHWPQWDDRFDAWHAGLMRMKTSSRTADQFGTLLAAAHMVIEDIHPDANTIDRKLKEWRFDRLAELADKKPDYMSCVAYLKTKAQQFQRGQETTVARLCQLVLGRIKRADPDVNKAAEDQWRASEALTHLGLRLEQRANPDRDGRDDWYLAVANDVQTTARLFDGSHWSGSSGTLPTFVKTLRRVPGALYGDEALEGKPTRSFNGHKSRVTLLPLSEILPDDDD